MLFYQIKGLSVASCSFKASYFQLYLGLVGLYLKEEAKSIPKFKIYKMLKAHTRWRGKSMYGLHKGVTPYTSPSPPPPPGQE